MIYHMVLLKVGEDVPQHRIDDVFSELALLEKKVAGILSFHGGPYSSDEGMNKGYTHGFCMTFESAATRNAYLPHPDHELVKAQVLAIVEGGVDGIVAFDFEA